MKSHKGFTLVELLLYAAIFVIVAGILTGVMVTVIRTQNRDAANNEVAIQLDFVLTTVQRLVRDASLVDVVYEGNSTSTECSAYCTLRLRMEDTSREPTIVRSDASGIYVKEGAGEEVKLTTDRITVDNFILKKFEVAGGHAAVQVDASFTFNSNNPQLAVTKSVQSAISRVSAATFDSDLLPNSDNAWSIGQLASRWKDLLLSGDLKVSGNASVGTTTSESSALLTLQSTSKGFLPPRMTTTQRDGIGSPATGLFIYNTTTNQFEWYNGSAWSAVGGSLWTATSADDIYRPGGHVGIGVTSPGSELEIQSTSGIAEIRLTEAGGASFSDWAIRVEQTNDDGIGIYNYVRDNYKLWIEEISGDVGIGTQTPSADLDVEGGSGRGIVEINGNSGGCLKLRDTDDAGWTYLTTNDGVLTATTTAC